MVCACVEVLSAWCVCVCGGVECMVCVCVEVLSVCVRVWRC